MFVALLAFQAFAATEPYWNWRNPTPQGNDYENVAYGAGRFVAVGRAGTITTSTDGVTWTAANSGVNADIYTIAYGNGRFVAKFGLSLLISDDGLTWTVANASVPTGWDTVNIITFANDRFFAMSNSSFVAQIGKHTVATSTDGINWTRSNEASDAHAGLIAFGGGSYVGQNMLTGDLKSTDGVTWTYDEVTMLYSSDGVTWLAGGATGLARISAGPIYFDNQWVVDGIEVTTSGGTKEFHDAFSVSSDGGKTWTLLRHETLGRSANTSSFPLMATFNGRLYYTGGINAPISSTVDFVTTRADVPAQLLQFNGIIATADRIVAVARYGRIASSTNGTDWTMFGSSTVTGNLRAGAFGAGTWILAGDAGLASSPDGIAWSMLPSTSGYSGGSIAYGNGRFVAGKTDGRVGISTDGGATWTDSGEVGVHGRIAFAQDRFVATGGLISSTDGVTWTAAVPPPGGTGHWNGVFEVDGVFYAVGTPDPNQETDGVIARSVDGVSWTTVATTSEVLSCVGGKGDLLVASGYNGGIWTSNDGVTWHPADGKPFLSLTPAASILWVGDSLVAVTLGGSVVTSVDGVIWAKDEFASSGTMFAMAAGNGQVLAMGAGGAIWEVGAARFTLQPESHTVAAGSSVNFSVGVTGKEPLSYQWLKDGSPIGTGTSSAFSSSARAYSAKASSISGTNNRILTISAASAADAGNYSVIVTNEFGSTESSPAALVVGASVSAPTITAQPTSRTVAVGTLVTFNVVATGDGTLTYQWRKNNEAIEGATQSTYTIPAASAADSGTYSVWVQNSGGTVISSGATLTVLTSQLVNISTRAYATTENGVTIGGFVIAGSDPKQVLIRAVGPTLTNFSLSASEVLADPIIELYRGEERLAANDNWAENSNASEIATTAGRVGASPLAATDTSSAALLITLEPGVYTFITKGKNNTSGIVLLEVYDADTEGSTFANISTRAHATQNNGVAIGGFVISGDAPKQVLMRAVGPTLTSYGLGQSEVLLDPTIELRQGEATLATNDNWGDIANVTDMLDVGSRIGASPLSSTDTQSAALLMTLEPGVYSFIVKGKNNTSGLVLVEIYNAD